MVGMMVVMIMIMMVVLVVVRIVRRSSCCRVEVRTRVIGIETTDGVTRGRGRGRVVVVVEDVPMVMVVLRRENRRSRVGGGQRVQVICVISGHGIPRTITSALCRRGFHFYFLHLGSMEVDDHYRFPNTNGHR